MSNDHLATFAGGCFWCMVAPFEAIRGVRSIVSGFTGGHVAQPSYEQVCTGTTGHLEAVQISFDVTQVDYLSLLNIFWQQIDPTDAGGSFFDRGSHYQSAIFYHNSKQQQLAQTSMQALNASQRFPAAIVTQLIAFQDFYPAKDEHQGYHKKHPEHYQGYRLASGRDHYLQSMWSEK